MNKAGRAPEANALTKTGIRFIFWISLDDHARLAEAAHTRQLSCGAIVRQLIRDFLAEQPAEINRD